jgi:hypothetical protein
MGDRRALLVGISVYDNHEEELVCAEDDAACMGDMLKQQWNGSAFTRNYDCNLLTSGKSRITRASLSASIRGLFSELSGGEALFYFSGHGLESDDGGYLVTQEADAEHPGYPMKELMDAANHSGGSVLIILDCCHSGQIGNITDGHGFNHVELGEGVTVLAASTALQVAEEGGMDNSLFTGLVLGALDGGAADVRGRVSAASVYGYVEQALGSWQQRPVYKSHAKRLRAIRCCKPTISDELLYELPVLFKHRGYRFQMDPSYEHSEEDHAVPEHVVIFKKFKEFRNAGLLTTEEDEDGKVKDLYFVALESLHVWLTPLGQFYWDLADKNRI